MSTKYCHFYKKWNKYNICNCRYRVQRRQEKKTSQQNRETSRRGKRILQTSAGQHVLVTRRHHTLQRSQHVAYYTTVNNITADLVSASRAPIGAEKKRTFLRPQLHSAGSLLSEVCGFFKCWFVARTQFHVLNRNVAKTADFHATVRPMQMTRP